MLTVKASAKPSKINRLGLFADEDIPKGTVTWRFDPRFDIYFDPKDVQKMRPEHKALIDNYAYLSTYSGMYVYSIDDSRFTNHSRNNNNVDDIKKPDEPEMCSIANRDIKKGEEILVNYCDFDANDVNGSDEYLKS